MRLEVARLIRAPPFLLKALCALPRRNEGVNCLLTQAQGKDIRHPAVGSDGRVYDILALRTYSYRARHAIPAVRSHTPIFGVDAPRGLPRRTGPSRETDGSSGAAAASRDCVPRPRARVPPRRSRALVHDPQSSAFTRVAPQRGVAANSPMDMKFSPSEGLLPTTAHANGACPVLIDEAHLHEDRSRPRLRCAPLGAAGGPTCSWGELCKGAALWQASSASCDDISPNRRLGAAPGLPVEPLRVVEEFEKALQIVFLVLLEGLVVVHLLLQRAAEALQPRATRSA